MSTEQHLDESSNTVITHKAGKHWREGRGRVQCHNDFGLSTRFFSSFVQAINHGRETISLEEVWLFFNANRLR